MSEIVDISDEFDNIYWHDSVLKSCSVATEGKNYNSMRVEVMFDVYSDESAPERHEIKLCFKEVSSYLLTLDAEELVNNCNSGNIVDAFSKKIGHCQKFRYFLLDGFLEIVAKRVEIRH
jgi:hypothetical protein